MKDLNSLINHPSMQGFDKLMLASNRPITLLRAGEQKTMGKPLSNQQLHGLLKASLAPAVLQGFGWGKELNDELQGNSGPVSVRIVLRPDKVIQVEMTPAEPALKLAPAAAPQTQAAPTPDPQPEAAPPAPEPEEEPVSDAADDPAVAEEVTRLTDAEQTALIYAPGGDGATAICEAVEQLGFPSRVTDNPAAAVEVLKYHDYPLFVMHLGTGFRQDAVYSFLIVQNMDMRRTQYSVLVSPGSVTGDTLEAFSKSVNLVVDHKDVGHMAEVMEKGVKDWKRFVKPLHDFLDAAGRL